MARIRSANKCSGGWTSVSFDDGAIVNVQQDSNGDICYVTPADRGNREEKEKAAINFVLRQREIAALEKIAQKKN